MASSNVWTPQFWRKSCFTPPALYSDRFSSHWKENRRASLELLPLFHAPTTSSTVKKVLVGAESYSCKYLRKLHWYACVVIGNCTLYTRMKSIHLYNISSCSSFHSYDWKDRKRLWKARSEISQRRIIRNKQTYFLDCVLLQPETLVSGTATGPNLSTARKHLKR